MTAIEIAELRKMASGKHRFRWVLSRAIADDRDQGEKAFRRYNLILGMLALETGHTLEAACGVFSALSPNNGYLGNLHDAAKMLRAQAGGRSMDNFQVHTYGNNKRKAWKIAGGEHPLREITADKTKNFYLNLIDPMDWNPVTIDGHIFNIWAGQRLPLKSRDPAQRLTRVAGRIYAEVAADVRAVARDAGMIPNQVQGILWITWRRLHGVTRPQDSLWDLDVEKAGLGFLKL